MGSQRKQDGEAQSRKRWSASFGIAGVAAFAGAGLFLWRRKRRLQGEESTADEVEAHPS